MLTEKPRIIREDPAMEADSRVSVARMMPGRVVWEKSSTMRQRMPKEVTLDPDRIDPASMD
jgi:hypothetical protein